MTGGACCIRRLPVFSSLIPIDDPLLDRHVATAVFGLSQLRRVRESRLVRRAFGRCQRPPLRRSRPAPEPRRLEPDQDPPCLQPPPTSPDPAGVCRERPPGSSNRSSARNHPPSPQPPGRRPPPIAHQVPATIFFRRRKPPRSRHRAMSRRNASPWESPRRRRWSQCRCWRYRPTGGSANRPSTLRDNDVHQRPRSSQRDAIPARGNSPQCHQCSRPYLIERPGRRIRRTGAQIAILQLPSPPAGWLDAPTAAGVCSPPMRTPALITILLAFRFWYTAYNRTVPSGPAANAGLRGEPADRPRPSISAGRGSDQVRPSSVESEKTQSAERSAVSPRIVLKHQQQPPVGKTGHSRF